MTTRSAEGEASHSPLSKAAVKRSVQLFDLGNGRKVSHEALQSMLPDVETALFFGQAYDLDFTQLSELVRLLFKTDLMDALLNEGHAHSVVLQDYIVGIVPDYIDDLSGIGYDEDVEPPDTELLKQMWEAATVEVAQSIKDVADKLGDVLDALPTKYGHMTFTHMRKMNVQRNSIGTFGAQIQHERVAPRLVVLDVSGSMTSSTVQRIAEEVVGLAYAVDAAMAIVSNNAYFWEPGAFTTADILAAAEYGGTQYEMLTPIFNRDWETVITIADYDSAWTALEHIRDNATGKVGQVLDISLVNKPTFLAECVGLLAREVKPILVGNSSYVMS